ncbi:MAG TPA: formimidoylglutamate deiminase [Caulobacteraceae bacterium]
MGALWFETALLPGGWASDVRVSCASGAISGVEVGVPAAAGDERAAIGVPGVGNLHSHAFQRAMAGLAETRAPGADDFWSWREAMYRFVERLTPEDVEAVAAQAFAEMLEGGFTRVGEFHYLHNDIDGNPYANPAEMAVRIAAAAETTGIGLTLLPVFYAHGAFGGQPPSSRQARFTQSIDSFEQLVSRARAAIAPLPDSRLGVAPHSLRAVTPDELAVIIPFADGGPIHIHVAEQRAEVDACLAALGARPVAWLLDHADTGQRWCLVHATHINEAETGRLAASGAVAGLCPITEANLGDGIFPAAPYIKAGGAFGVGSDSNVRIDLSEELRLLEYGQRLTRRARGVLASEARPSVGASLFLACLAGAARALGQAEFGIETGASADLVSLRAEHPTLVARRGDAILDGWIFAAGREAVDTVWRRGVRVVEDGRHVRAEAIGRKYRATLERILGR